MGPRFGLLLPLLAGLLSGPALAQSTSGPIQLTPTPLGPGNVIPPPPIAPSPMQSAPFQPLPPSPAPSAAQVPPPTPPLTVPPEQETFPIPPEQSRGQPREQSREQSIVKRSVLPVPKSNLAPTPPPAFVPHTLAEALAATYSNQPILQSERARLRATDENVPAALSGWRPTVQMQGSVGYGNGLTRSLSFAGTNRIYINTPAARDIGTAALQAQETLYNGGKNQANINRAKNQVRAERATLIAQEQTSFTNAVNAYVGVIQAKQTLDLNINNEAVLAKQLQATNDRFRVGEITRTDVAQAEAALSGATAQRQTAEGQLEAARGTFQQIIGVLPPADLVPPQPLNLRLKDETEAIAMAATNNPQVICGPVQSGRGEGRGGRGVRGTCCRRSRCRRRCSSRTTRRVSGRRRTAIRRP